MSGKNSAKWAIKGILNDTVQKAAVSLETQSEENTNQVLNDQVASGIEAGMNKSMDNEGSEGNRTLAYKFLGKQKASKEDALKEKKSRKEKEELRKRTRKETSELESKFWKELENLEKEALREETALREKAWKERLQVKKEVLKQKTDLESEASKEEKEPRKKAWTDKMELRKKEKKEQRELRKASKEKRRLEKKMLENGKATANRIFLRTRVCWNKTTIVEGRVSQKHACHESTWSQAERSITPARRERELRDDILQIGGYLSNHLGLEAASVTSWYQFDPR